VDVVDYCPLVSKFRHALTVIVFPPLHTQFLLLRRLIPAPNGPVCVALIRAQVALERIRTDRGNTNMKRGQS
jgi:hypothetical protein